MTDDQEELVNTLAQLHGDKSETLGPLLERYRSRLEVMIELRLDRRLRNRIDTADVVQETYLEAARRIDRYLEDPQMPFYLWLRFIAGQKVLEMERFHLGAQGRDARREVAAPREPRASSESIARVDRTLHESDARCPAGRSSGEGAGDARVDARCGPGDPGHASLRTDEQSRCGACAGHRTARSE